MFSIYLLENIHYNVSFGIVKVWYAVTKTNEIQSRSDLYKCLALMALAQQGKPIDEKLLDNYADRGISLKKMTKDLFSC